MEFDFSDKRALVTGATRGIGRATARLMHKLGAKVVAVCCNQEWLNELAEELPGIELINVDLSDWKATEAALADIGPVDFLFNNVGIGVFVPLMQVTEDHFDSMANVNLKSTYSVTKMIAKSMIEHRVKGSIVNVASIAAYYPAGYATVYAALKSATVNLTKCMAKDLAVHQLRLGVVERKKMDFDFRGKRALITGATRGIGRGTARLMHKLGAKVVAVCCNQEWLNQLADELPGIELINIDLGDWKATEEALANIGPIDYLLNNVGMGIFVPLMKVTEEQFDSLANVNLKSTYSVTKMIAKSMIEQGIRGSIVNMASVSAYHPADYASIYSALKAATVNLTKCMAKDLAPHQIRVNAVAPGVVETDITKAVIENEELKKQVLDKQPIKTIIQPEDVAKAVCFLMSDHASVITGVVLPVDAGYLLNPF